MLDESATRLLAIALAAMGFDAIDSNEVPLTLDGTSGIEFIVDPDLLVTTTEGDLVLQLLLPGGLLPDQIGDGRGDRHLDRYHLGGDLLLPCFRSGGGQSHLRGSLRRRRVETTIRISKVLLVIDVGKEGSHRVEIPGGVGVVLVIMALGAAEGRTHPRLR